MKTLGSLLMVLDFQGMSLPPLFSARWVAPSNDSMEAFAITVVEPNGTHHALTFDVLGYLSCQVGLGRSPESLPNGLYILKEGVPNSSLQLPHPQTVSAWKKIHPSVAIGKLYLAILILGDLRAELVITGAEYDFVNIEFEKYGQ
jgi:hypothetical protein